MFITIIADLSENKSEQQQKRNEKKNKIFINIRRKQQTKRLLTWRNGEMENNDNDPYAEFEMYLEKIKVCWNNLLLFAKSFLSFASEALFWCAIVVCFAVPYFFFIEQEENKKNHVLLPFFLLLLNYRHLERHGLKLGSLCHKRNEVALSLTHFTSELGLKYLNAH